MNLDALIPHRGNMQLIDEVVQQNDEQLWCRALVDSANPFVTAGGLPTGIGLEWMAQTAAAFFTLQSGPSQPPQQGMLIGCPRYEVNQPFFPPATRWLIHVERTTRAQSRLIKFKGSIYPDSREAPTRTSDWVANGELSVYI